MRHARTVLMRAAAAPGLTGALAPSRLLSIHAAMLAVYAGTIPFYLKEDGIGFGRTSSFGFGRISRFVRLPGVAVIPGVLLGYSRI